MVTQETPVVGGPLPRGKKRMPKRRRNALIVLGSVLALLAIAAGVVLALAAASYNSIQRLDMIDPNLSRPPAYEGADAPLNVLLLGSDSRIALDANASADELTGFRSDTIMVAQISGDRQDVTFMSIMRDNWVEIPGHGEAKINAAVAFGGIPLAVNTIENFIGARIDHVALVDFESFQGLTDALGGVTVNNEIAFGADNGRFQFPEGEITLHGEEALWFVRERYAFSDGDYQRAKNQQVFLKGLLKEMLSKDTLTNPATIASTLNAVSPYLILDSGLDLGTAGTIGYELRGVRSGDIAFFTSPTLGTGTSADGQSIVLPDWAEIENVREAFTEGTLRAYYLDQQEAS